MLRAFVVALALGCSVASAQVVFEPTVPPQPVNPYPDNPYLSLHQALFMRNLFLPRLYVTVQIVDANGNVRVSTSTAPAFSPQSAQDASIDPQTGEPLYFRKRDIMPPGQQPQTRPADRADTSVNAPDEQPVQMVADPPYPHRGEIVIIPYRARRAPAIYTR